MMRRRAFTASACAAAASACSSPVIQRGHGATPSSLDFEPGRFRSTQVQAEGRVVDVRVYERLPIVGHAVEPDYQALNLYVPEAYFHGQGIGRYTARTAPVFLPNGVGGYMPARPGTLDPPMAPPPAPGQAAPASAAAVALGRGHVVAAPGARGRTLRVADGRWTGKAPAAIVDLKAAVRWLRHQAGRLPGDMERITSNGTSAGGALSALLGASGNHTDYEGELDRIGALPGRDDVFAVSAYCPITNLAHADAAYEWQFHGQKSFRAIDVAMLDYRVQRKEITRQLSETQLVLSSQLRAQFVDYVNGLGLTTPGGQALRLDAQGRGSLREHLEALILASAQRALDLGQSLADRAWLRLASGRVVAVDFDGYRQAAGRMKSVPAFDALALDAGENQLFGDATTDARHFTAFSLQHSAVSGAARADDRTVQPMDAMSRASDPASRLAMHWRIRHGTLDTDTSLAIPALLAAALRARGRAVDLALPWDRPHSGDYDLAELFDWIDGRVAAA